jgi:RNA polymerase sigma-70 factor (ECF subfamily)
LNKELGKILEKSILALPEKYKIVFTLRELNELSIAETSEALSISAGNVKARLSRAKSMLRSEIEKMYSREEIFDFNLIYCDGMVDRVMNAIENLP